MTTGAPPPASSLKAEFNLRYVWLVAGAAALGGLLFGWDWVVIGGAKPFFERYFALTSPALVGWANSCALIGCLAGAVVAQSEAARKPLAPMLSIQAYAFKRTNGTP